LLLSGPDGRWRTGAEEKEGFLTADEDMMNTIRREKIDNEILQNQ
jgi:hypothetical protein